ncbi:uncharacterized protein LOC134077214 isoform X2 [Sardina pilchardus]|uniref:uncharacterized protein LOC134077214 isoform X2 n=1 Tax=Sardina pilchardus TaxID=27697 RepID=UPI002E0EAB03
MAHLQQEPNANPRPSAQRPAVRPMHETTLTLKDSADTNYTTVMAEHNVLYNSRMRNWTRSHEGLAMKEVTNPTGSTLFRSSYHDNHQNPSSSIGHGVTSMGRPTAWHSHDILTGEDKRPAGPGKPKTTRDDSLRAQRRWETDSSALRLY